MWWQILVTDRIRFVAVTAWFTSAKINKNINNISETAIEYISEHVSTSNPVTQSGNTKTPEQNKPFFMYLSYRAPHRPNSHDFVYDETNPNEMMPYLEFGKERDLTHSQNIITPLTIQKYVSKLKRITTLKLMCEIHHKLCVFYYWLNP